MQSYEYEWERILKLVCGGVAVNRVWVTFVTWYHFMAEECWVWHSTEGKKGNNGEMWEKKDLLMKL